MNKIVTLGNFDIIINGQSVVHKIASKRTLLRLFKYFLIHNEKKLLPEKIIEDLWGNEDIENPLNRLRCQICRIRKIMTENETDGKHFCSIEYINGCYVFKVDERFIIDFVEFEKYLDGDVFKIKKAIENDFSGFKDLLLLYDGEFLQELEDEPWVMITRNRLDRLYVRGLLYYINYLKKELMYNEIIDICEKAKKIKPYEESINLEFMESLVILGEDAYALMHYEFFTRKLFNDLRVAPSKKLSEFYKKTKQKDNDCYSNIDLNVIDEEMIKEFDFKGVALCDLKYFKFIYNYERTNKNRRKNTDIGIALITIESKSYKELTAEEIKKGTNLVIYSLLKCLRAGDVISKWNESQTLILLYGLRQDKIQYVVDKINDQFNLVKFDEKLSLNIKINIL